jgi:CubicO group peptidase (beta-lactamase class C family)
MMRWLPALLIVMCLPSCWAMRAYKVRKLRLTDHEKLPYVHIAPSAQPYSFTDGRGREEYSELKEYLDSNLEQSQTAAFLVIRNDSILYERYFDGFDEHSILPSNSMAKSFTGSLVAIAHEEGRIKSLSDPVTKYIPELLETDPRYERITLQHLLDMRSGLQFNEGSYDLKDDGVKLGFRPNIKKHLLRVKIAEEPGRFRYQSVNTQMLGLVLERATGKKISAYLEEKIWKPMGAERGATWNVDSRKRRQEIASAGLNAIARDFARFARLYTHHGRAGERQVIPAYWVQTVSHPDTMEKYGGYKNHWWSRQAFRSFPDSLQAAAYRSQTRYPGNIRVVGSEYRVSYRTHGFMAIGFLNQGIYINPSKNLIIIRIGRRWRHPSVWSTQFLNNLGERL